MVNVGANECYNIRYGRNQFVFLVFVHLLLLGLNGTNAQNRAPRIKEHPSNTVSGRSEPATLRCVVEGRPKPSVFWYKDGYLLPSADDGHRVILEDGLLFLKVNRGKKDSDEGVYWCVARNIAGEASSRNATLAVAILRDDFRVEPRDSQVSVGEPTILDCVPPKGVPEPAVHWLKDNRPLDVEVNGRVTISNNGSLKILETLPIDTGTFQCVASNMAGERQSRRATLIVLRRPHFLVKPSNITALVGQSVEFNCQSHDSSVNITWTREDGPLPKHATRNRGLLRLEHVSAADAGVYSCRANSHAGSSITNATLTVYSLPHFTQIPSNLTAWEGDVVSIPCEAKGLPTPTTFWILEGNQDSLLFPECTKINSSLLYLDDVRVENSGRVICVAVNAAGSVMSAAFINILSRSNNNHLNDMPPELDFETRDKSNNHMTQYELEQARKYLQQNVLVLRKLETLSSNSIKVVWDVMTDYNEYLEGVKIWYNATSMNWRNATAETQAAFNSSHSNTIFCSNGSLLNIDNSGSSSYTVSGLIPYTQFDVFLMPFYKTLLGKPSNMMAGITDEEVPSAPPQSVTAGVINSTSAFIRWEPPPVNTWNGELIGFLIEIRVSMSGGGRIVGQMSLGPSNRAAAVSSLRQGGKYSARAAAVTKKGRGPFSTPAQIHMIPAHMQRQYVQTEPPSDPKTNLLQETWLLALCLTLFTVIIIGLISFYYYRKRNQMHRKKATGQSIVTAQQCLLNKDTIWLRDRPLYASSNDQTVDVVSCHQSLLHGGQSTGVLSVEPEYSLPQNSIQGLDLSSVDRLRRAPEPYASSAIYTELNFKDNGSGDLRHHPERRSHNNSIVRSCNGSIQYSTGECSTCCHSTSSRSTNRDYREPVRYVQENDINIIEDDCQSCHTNRSGSRSRQDKSKVCPTNDLEYDYPQWHWLGRDNSFKIPIQMRQGSVGKSDQGCQINLCDILPPPPYETPETKN